MNSVLRFTLAFAFAIATTAAMAQASKCQPGCVNTPTETCACR